MSPGPIIDMNPKSLKLLFCQPRPTPSSLPFSYISKYSQDIYYTEATQTHGQMKHNTMMNN